jgi:hypothetical protein
MDQLADFGRRLEGIVDTGAKSRIMNKAGAAGKKSALDAAADDLGGDRAMSNLRKGRARLSAGYDAGIGATTVIKFRGPWKLANDGRRASGAIWPKARGGKRAVMTPMGPRARSSYHPSRGLNTYDDAVKDARREVPKAAFRQLQAEIAKAVH